MLVTLNVINTGLLLSSVAFPKHKVGSEPPQHWLNWSDELLTMERKSKSTRLSYWSALKRWCTLVSCIENPSQNDLRLWLRDRRNSVAQSRFNQEIYAIKGFYSRAYRLSVIKTNHASMFPKQRRADQKIPKTLNEWQIGNLLAAPDLKTAVGVRDTCVMRLIFETGIKGNNLILLDIADILINTRLVRIGDKRACMSPISADMSALLQRWIDHGARLKPGLCAPTDYI